MQPLKETNVYIPVDVNVELPKESNKYFVKTNVIKFNKLETDLEICFIDLVDKKYYGSHKPTHWLKEQTGYFLTKQGMEELLKDTYYWGHLNKEETFGEKYLTLRKMYIDKILNNE